jgi:hypothetical protein
MLRWIVVGIVASVLGCGKGSTPQPMSLADQEITIVGKNYCLGCALARAGAAARCDVYGHRHTLKVDVALDANDKPLGELIGETLHYLDTDSSASLVDSDDFDDKEIRVKGHLYAHERTIEVRQVEIL